MKEAKEENFQRNLQHNFVNSLVKKKPLNLIRREKQENQKRQLYSQQDFQLLGKFIRFVNCLCLESLLAVNLLCLAKVREELYRDRKNGLFTTAPNFSETSIQFTNKEEDMVRELFFIVEENVKVVKDVPKILGNQVFDQYVDSIGPPEEKQDFQPDI